MEQPTPRIQKEDRDLKTHKERAMDLLKNLNDDSEIFLAFVNPTPDGGGDLELVLSMEVQTTITIIHTWLKQSGLSPMQLLQGLAFEELNENGAMIQHERMAEQEFEDFKRRLINEINAIKHTDDPHIVAFVSKGHDEPRRFGLGCPGFLRSMAVELVKASWEPPQNEQPVKITGKGGMA